METKLKILSEDEIQSNLKEVSGWKYQDNKISKEFDFDSFMDTIAFIIKLAPFSEANEHHPDIHIFYTKIRFDLQRFDVGGKVTDKDFLVAKQIEKLFRQYKGTEKIRNYSGLF